MRVRPKEYIPGPTSLNPCRLEDDKDCISSRTLMIVGVPESYCTEEFLRRHFHEAYPACEIDDVQVAHDVSKLCSLDRRRERARRARMYCENYRNKHGSGQQGG